MTIQEFLDKYRPLNSGYGGKCKQAYWDLMEEVEEIFRYRKNENLETKIGAVKYRFHNLLEICDKTLHDYDVMSNALKDLDEVKTIPQKVVCKSKK